MRMLDERERSNTTPYEAILDALCAVPWDRASEAKVTPIEPLDRENIDFFPGQRGFFGPEFPHQNGIMIVGNNFSSLYGWEKYRESADRQSEIPTWQKLRMMIDASGLGIERFWFTNYCHGVMDRKRESYRFPKQVLKRLEFDQLFEKCVVAMKPVLIVSLGSLASELLKTDYKQREKIDRRSIAGHPTKLIATVHPSAWTWNKRGFTIEDFRREGDRIREALHLRQ